MKKKKKQPIFTYTYKLLEEINLFTSTEHPVAPRHPAVIGWQTCRESNPNFYSLLRVGEDIHSFV